MGKGFYPLPGPWFTTKRNFKVICFSMKMVVSFVMFELEAKVYTTRGQNEKNSSFSAPTSYYISLGEYFVTGQLLAEENFCILLTRRVGEQAQRPRAIF